MYEKAEVLWYFYLFIYLTPSCSFLQLTHYISPTCAPKRCLTPGTWSQHMQYHKEQTMLWDFFSSFLLEFLTYCSSFSLSGGGGGAVSSASCTTTPKLSCICWLGKQGPKLKTWQMVLMVDEVKSQYCSADPGRNLTCLCTLDKPKLNAFNLKLHAGTSPMLLSV